MASVKQDSQRDSWLIDNSINVTLPTSLSSQEIAERLVQSRSRLEQLKREYVQTTKKSAKQISLFHEIVRVAKAIEAMKDRLVIDGLHFAIDDRDIEHPEAARKRLGWWHWPVGLAVAAGIIGLGAKLFLGATIDDAAQTTTQPVASQPTSSYEAGRTDWHKWSDWEHSLDGDKLAGVRFWAKVRSNKPTPSCANERGAYSSDFRDACEIAKRSLTSIDRARGSDPDYRRGWNAGARETGGL